MLKSPSTKRFWFQSSERSAHARIQVANAESSGHPGRGILAPDDVHGRQDELDVAGREARGVGRPGELLGRLVDGVCRGSTISPTRPDGCTRSEWSRNVSRSPLPASPSVTSDVMNRHDEPSRSIRKRSAVVLRRTSCTAKTSKCETTSAISATDRQSRLGESLGPGVPLLGEVAERPQVPAADQQVGAGPRGHSRAYCLAQPRELLGDGGRHRAHVS